MSIILNPKFSIIRRITAIVFILALVAYMGFLLYSQYHSQNELQKYYLNQMLLDAEKHAIAINYFFSEREDDLLRLADSHELSVYFENLALGMSMEYGLSASLMDIKTAFAKFRDRRKLAGKIIFSRVVFLDAHGNQLIDVGEKGTNDPEGIKGVWDSFVVKNVDKPIFFAEGHDSSSSISISLPYMFKGMYRGQIIAVIRPELVYKQFITEYDVSSLRPISTLVYNNQYLYMPKGLPRDRLPAPEKLLKKGSFRFVISDGKDIVRYMDSYYTPIGNTPFSLVTFMSEKSQLNESSPRMIIIITGGIGIIILIGAFIIIRTTMNNAVLNARLLEIGIREEAIAEKNRSLRKLTEAVEQSANSVIITGTDGNIEYVNNYFTQLTGYSKEEAIGNNLDFLKVTGESEDTNRKMLQAVTAGEQWSGELHILKKSGELYWEYASISPLKNDAAETISCIAIKQDITERKLAEENIIRLNAELEQRVRERTAALETSNRQLENAYTDLQAAQSKMLQQEKMASIGQLAAGVAHEINNPMGFITSNLTSLDKYVVKLKDFISRQSDLLQNGKGDHELERLKEKRKELKIDFILEDIKDLTRESLSGAERVKKIVQDLKSFSRVDQAEYKQADINECIESTINIVWNELKYKATITREYGEIPLTICYPQQLNQVFMNILMNAANAIEKQGQITVRTWKDDGSILASVCDTGCGMASEIMKRIFEPFFTTKEVGKGTGLGLSITYDIIKNHGGEITVQSEIGKGSCFTIRIPIVEENRV